MVNIHFRIDNLVHYCQVWVSCVCKVSNQDVIAGVPDVVFVSFQELAHPLSHNADGNSFHE